MVILKIHFIIHSWKGGCFDDKNWEDGNGDGCRFYNENPEECKTAENFANGDGIAATHACCTCMGTWIIILLFYTYVPKFICYNQCTCNI